VQLFLWLTGSANIASALGEEKFYGIFCPCPPRKEKFYGIFCPCLPREEKFYGIFCLCPSREEKFYGIFCPCLFRKKNSTEFSVPAIRRKKNSTEFSVLTSSGRKIGIMDKIALEFFNFDFILILNFYLCPFKWKRKQSLPGSNLSGIHLMFDESVKRKDDQYW
jgi:hypothetical protein